jgi:hypothetical protein
MLTVPAATAFAQTGDIADPRRPSLPPRRTQATPAATSIILPAADALLTVDMQRLFTEVVPRSLASDPERLTQFNADVEQFKARTGINARDFDSLAVGARLVPLSSGAIKIDNVTAIAHGTFRADALVAAARAAAKGTLTEKPYGGKTVYVASINDQLKLFGLLKSHVRDLAFAVLDPNTLALGEPEDVRAAIDAQAGHGVRADLSMLNFPRGAGDFIAFAGKVPPGLLSGMDSGLPNVDRAVASIQSFYGTVGSTPAGIQLATALRTQTDADAKQLYDTAGALRQIAPGLISMAGPKAKFAQSAINNLKITIKGNEVQLRLEVPQADISALLRVL